MRKSLDGYVVTPLFEELRKTPEVSPQGKKLFLGYGTGRCGMNWFRRILTSHDNAEGGCERFSDFEVFFRYFHFHGLDVDLTGFHELLKSLRNYDWSRADNSVIYSPYFDFGMSELVGVLDPDAVFFHIRRPEDAVNSMWCKGWYKGDYLYGGHGKAPGPQPLVLPFYHHNFGRIMPRGEFFEEWSNMTRIGRIAWYYVETNKAMLAQHETFGNKAWTVKLADVDQNYDYYRMMAGRLGLSPLLSRETFLGLKGGMPNNGKTKRYDTDWSSEERADFNRMLDPFYEVYENLRTTNLEEAS